MTCVKSVCAVLGQVQAQVPGVRADGSMDGVRLDSLGLGAGWTPCGRTRPVRNAGGKATPGLKKTPESVQGRRDSVADAEAAATASGGTVEMVVTVEAKAKCREGEGGQAGPVGARLAAAAGLRRGLGLGLGGFAVYRARGPGSGGPVDAPCGLGRGRLCSCPCRKAASVTASVEASFAVEYRSRGQCSDRNIYK